MGVSNEPNLNLIHLLPMKRISTPIWMSLAIALSPLAMSQEVPAEQQAPEVVAAAPAEEAAAVASKAEEIAAMQTAIAEARKEAASVAGERDAALKETIAIREAKQQLEAQLADLRAQLEQSNHEVWQWKDKVSVLEKKLGSGEEAFAKLASFRDEVSVAMKEMAVLKEGNEVFFAWTVPGASREEPSGIRVARATLAR